MTEQYWTEADVKRFNSYIDRLPNGCHFWTGGRSRGKGNKKWYGSFYVNGKTIRAHRFACDVAGKDCPEGYHRDHSCVFSLCVNEEHIDIVTKAENQEKKVTRHNVKKTILPAGKAADTRSRTRQGHDPEGVRASGPR